MLNVFLTFTTGLLASLHCVGMCGGFVAAYSLHLAGSSGASPGLAAAFQPRLTWAHLLYNAGRLTTYTVLGGLMGLVGSFVGASGKLIGVQGLASILAGAFMILLGLAMGRWIPYTAWLQPVGVSRLNQLHDLGERLAEKANTMGTFPLGLLLGLMPCGPLYAMEINAAGTGSVSQGMLTLFAFGLGTVPTLYAFGLVSTVLGHQLPRRFFKIAAGVIVVLGVHTVLRGLAMNGLIPHVGLW